VWFAGLLAMILIQELSNMNQECRHVADMRNAIRDGRKQWCHYQEPPFSVVKKYFL
jgi:hypothetical protein